MSGDEEDGGPKAAVLLLLNANRLHRDTIVCGKQHHPLSNLQKTDTHAQRHTVVLNYT